MLPIAVQDVLLIPLWALSETGGKDKEHYKIKLSICTGCRIATYCVSHVCILLIHAQQNV
jgi:hypothetical protein